MPVVAVVDGILVMFFFNDHDPPHFHAEYAEFRARIRIDTFEIIEGRLPVAKRRRLIQWARERQSQLQQAWDEAREELKPRRIR